jgi:hypothetical protein
VNDKTSENEEPDIFRSVAFGPLLSMGLALSKSRNCYLRLPIGQDRREAKVKIVEIGPIHSLLGKGWIEPRRREGVGPSRRAAEIRLSEIHRALIEGRHVHKDKNARIMFDALCHWYLDLAEIKAKKSYRRDQFLIRALKAFFSGRAVKDITISAVQTYRQKRLSENSYHKHATRPATVNREMACLKHMLYLAEEDGKIEALPFTKLKILKENNVRNRLLSDEEYHRLIAHCPPHTARIVKMGYFKAMRQGEILHLTWDEVDLKNGVVRPKPRRSLGMTHLCSYKLSHEMRSSFIG